VRRVGLGLDSDNNKDEEEDGGGHGSCLQIGHVLDRVVNHGSIPENVNILFIFMREDGRRRKEKNRS